MLLARDNIKLPIKQSKNILKSSTKECLMANYHHLTKLKLRTWRDKNVSVKSTYWSGREKVLEDIILKCYQNILTFNTFLIRCATKWYTYIKCKIWATQETIMSCFGRLRRRPKPLV